MNTNTQGPSGTIEAIQAFAKAPSPNVTKISGYHEGRLEIGTGLDSNCVLWVAEGAHMKGDAIAAQVFCEGRIEGNVRAKVVTLEKNGSIDGNITCSYLLVQHPQESTIHAKIGSLNPQRQSPVANNENAQSQQQVHQSTGGGQPSFQSVDTATPAAA